MSQPGWVFGCRIERISCLCAGLRPLSSPALCGWAPSRKNHLDWESNRNAQSKIRSEASSEPAAPLRCLVGRVAAPLRATVLLWGCAAEQGEGKGSPPPPAKLLSCSSACWGGLAGRGLNADPTNPGAGLHVLTLLSPWALPEHRDQAVGGRMDKPMSPAGRGLGWGGGGHCCVLQEHPPGGVTQRGVPCCGCWQEPAVGLSPGRERPVQRQPSLLKSDTRDFPHPLGGLKAGKKKRGRKRK